MEEYGMTEHLDDLPEECPECHSPVVDTDEEVDKDDLIDWDAKRELKQGY
jgi:hypothetical protein